MKSVLCLPAQCYVRLRSDEVGLLQRTGLTSPSHLLSRQRTSVFGHVAWWRQTCKQGFSAPRKTYHSTDLLTVGGVAHLVVHGTSGWASFEAIPPVRLETSGGVLSAVDMVAQRCDGPRRLCRHDDDNDKWYASDELAVAHCLCVCLSQLTSRCSIETARRIARFSKEASFDLSDN